MSATRRDVRACRQCRLTFSSRHALRRHDALDHRAAPDGACLTAQIVGRSHASDGPHRVGAGDDRGGGLLVEPLAPTPAERPVVAPTSSWFLGPFALTLLVLTALTVPAGLVAALAVLMLTWDF